MYVYYILPPKVPTFEILFFLGQFLSYSVQEFIKSIAVFIMSLIGMCLNCANLKLISISFLKF